MEDRRQAMVLFLPRDRRYPSEILFAPMHGYLKATGKDPGGPKIGQEYSVPFVEEEWADDEYVNVDALLVHNTNTFVTLPKSASRYLKSTIHIKVVLMFFEYANFRLPLFTFLVNVLKHYRIHISQLSVIGAANVSHFEILCRVHGFEPTVGLFRCFYVNSKNKGWVSFSKRPGNTATCYTKPLDSLKNWNDRFFWADSFACPASFLWNTSTTVSKDPFPKSSQYNAKHYATLVAHPTPFHKYPEPFLCLVGISRYYTLDENTYPQFLRDNDEEMDLFAFIRTADPTKVRVGERQRGDDEPKLLDATVGRTVPLLSVAPARAESELDASVNRLFDEEGSGNQEGQIDSAGGNQGAGIQFAGEALEVVAEDVAPLPLRQKKKRKTLVDDDGEPSHPAKKLRDDHGAPGGPTVGGKSRSTVQRLLAGVVLNAEVRGEVIPTLPFVVSSVSATPERKKEDHIDTLAGANLRTIGASQRFIISSDSSYHSGTRIAETEVDSLIRSSAPAMITATTVTATADATTVVKETVTKPSLFAVASSFAGETEPTLSGFSDLTGGDLLVGGIRTVVDPDSDLQKVYVPRWNVTNGSLLDDRAARQMTLGAEVRMRAEYNIKEKRKLKSVVDEKDILLKARDKEIESLRAQLLVKEAEATEAIRLRAKAAKFEFAEKSLRDEAQFLKDRNTSLEKERSELDVRNDSLADQVCELETSSAGLCEKVAVYESCMSRLEKFQDEQMSIVHDKFNKLDADFVKTYLHLEEKFYHHLLTTIAGRRWLLTHGVKLTVFKCLNSPEYLSVLWAAISKTIEKGMHDGLVAEITHGREGRVLADVVAFNPFAKSDFSFALQEVQNVNFSLFTELMSHKDASIETVMDLLRLDEALAERLGLNELQPHVDQLMVPVHHSPDQIVIGARALSLSLDVSHGWVQRIRENIANNISALRDVFVSFSKPLSVVALEGTRILHVDGQEGIAVDVADRSKLIPKSLLFLIISTSAVLKVGMPISTRTTASVPYVSENGVSSLLDLIIVRCAHKTCGISST
ncbi:hypothetical protein Tco_0490969 [Tanacetum coccineum]